MNKSNPIPRPGGRSTSGKPPPTSTGRKRRTASGGLFGVGTGQNNHNPSSNELHSISSLRSEGQSSTNSTMLMKPAVSFSPGVNLFDDDDLDNFVKYVEDDNDDEEEEDDIERQQQQKSSRSLLKNKKQNEASQKQLGGNSGRTTKSSNIRLQDNAMDNNDDNDAEDQRGLKRFIRSLDFGRKLSKQKQQKQFQKQEQHRRASSFSSAPLHQQQQHYAPPLHPSSSRTNNNHNMNNSSRTLQNIPTRLTSPIQLTVDRSTLQQAPPSPLSEGTGAWANGPSRGSSPAPPPQQSQQQQQLYDYFQNHNSRSNRLPPSSMNNNNNNNNPNRISRTAVDLDSFAPTTSRNSESYNKTATTTTTNTMSTSRGATMGKNSASEELLQEVTAALVRGGGDEYSNASSASFSARDLGHHHHNNHSSSNLYINSTYISAPSMSEDESYNSSTSTSISAANRMLLDAGIISGGTRSPNNNHYRQQQRHNNMIEPTLVSPTGDIEVRYDQDRTLSIGEEADDEEEDSDESDSYFDDNTYIRKTRDLLKGVTTSHHTNNDYNNNNNKLMMRSSSHSRNNNRSSLFPMKSSVSLSSLTSTGNGDDDDGDAPLGVVGGTAIVDGMDMEMVAFWKARMDRNEIYTKHYAPSRQEQDEITLLEEYLGIYSNSPTNAGSTASGGSGTSRKDKWVPLWKQLVLKSSSPSSPSSMTTSSIILKRGPIQFDEFQDYHCELIFLTRGFVVARPNFQFIPRFQAGDLWTSVVQIQPNSPTSFTIHCSTRGLSSNFAHLTLAQLKQQQQYDSYQYTFSCATTLEQSAWLEALRIAVIRAHDAAGTEDKEEGGLGWQYRLVYVPFFTEAVTGNPILKENILSGSCQSDGVTDTAVSFDLNKLDSYNSYAPLHYATRANHTHVMRFLLEAGADAQIGDGYGRTPMYYGTILFSRRLHSIIFVFIFAHDYLSFFIFHLQIKAELHQLPDTTIQLLEAYGAERSKKIAAGYYSRHPRSCQRRLILAAIILVLLVTGTGIVLWQLGILDPVLKATGIVFEQNIGGGPSPTVNDKTRAPTSMPSPERTKPYLKTKLPVSAPTKYPLILSNRGIDETDSPYPTDSPSLSPSINKTPVPTTTAAEGDTQSPITPPPTLAPSPFPTSVIYQTDLYQLLEAASFDYGAALRVEGSPQQKAFVWLLQNANLDSYSNAKKIQRYALATFYYSTNGDGWSEKLWYVRK